MQDYRNNRVGCCLSSSLLRAYCIGSGGAKPSRAERAGAVSLLMIVCSVTSALSATSAYFAERAARFYK
jgi:hypothetical protein